MGDCQNYSPFLGPYYNMGPNLRDPKRDHTFDNPQIYPFKFLRNRTPCRHTQLWSLHSPYKANRDIVETLAHSLALDMKHLSCIFLAQAGSVTLSPQTLQARQDEHYPSPQSRQHGPRTLNIAQSAIILHTFGSRYSALGWGRGGSTSGCRKPTP